MSSLERLRGLAGSPRWLARSEVFKSKVEMSPLEPTQTLLFSNTLSFFLGKNVVVGLLERKGNTLKIRGIDAADKTPVIDIKPCTLRDMKENIKTG